jgi:hypothetical protein
MSEVVNVSTNREVNFSDVAQSCEQKIVSETEQYFEIRARYHFRGDIPEQGIYKNITLNYQESFITQSSQQILSLRYSKDSNVLDDNQLVATKDYQIDYNTNITFKIRQNTNTGYEFVCYSKLQGEINEVEFKYDKDLQVLDGQAVNVRCEERRVADRKTLKVIPLFEDRDSAISSNSSIFDVYYNAVANPGERIQKQFLQNSDGSVTIENIYLSSEIFLALVDQSWSCTYENTILTTAEISIGNTPLGHEINVYCVQEPVDMTLDLNITLEVEDSSDRLTGINFNAKYLDVASDVVFNNREFNLSGRYELTYRKGTQVFFTSNHLETWDCSYVEKVDGVQQESKQLLSSSLFMALTNQVDINCLYKRPNQLVLFHRINDVDTSATHPELLKYDVLAPNGNILDVESLMNVSSVPGSTVLNLPTDSFLRIKKTVGTENYECKIGSLILSSENPFSTRIHSSVQISIVCNALYYNFESVSVSGELGENERIHFEFEHVLSSQGSTSVSLGLSNLSWAGSLISLKPGSEIRIRKETVPPTGSFPGIGLESNCSATVHRGESTQNISLNETFQGVSVGYPELSESSDIRIEVNCTTELNDPN